MQGRGLTRSCHFSLPGALCPKPRQTNLETIRWAAALVNKLFIVTEWLGQRSNTSLKLKAYGAQLNTILAQETGSSAGKNPGERLTPGRAQTCVCSLSSQSGTPLP